MSTLTEIVREITGAQSVDLGKVIQTLWSGYGVIQNAVLTDAPKLSDEPRLPVVLKHIDISRARSNPRGWGNDNSHQRKVRSYEVEKAFYESYSQRCSEQCRVPRFLAAQSLENAGGWVIVLEDLNTAGFAIRKSTVRRVDVLACLAWLANFHATFLNDAASDLWPVGTYWHLATRGDELHAMPPGRLKQAAHSIDTALNSARYQTLVHGDAKVANFCFSETDPSTVAAVDFQYVGRGCGMKDVAYFISSCLSEREAAEQRSELLGYYFDQLQTAINAKRNDMNFGELQNEWMDLYAFAWADFCRFLSGWSPGHWKLNSHTDRITQAVLDQLD
ncbi:MAG: DUF1679 domain-containing protein [Aureliella sp.]